MAFAVSVGDAQSVNETNGTNEISETFSVSLSILQAEISCHASSHETLPAVAMGKAPHRRKAARPAQPVPPASSSQFGRSTPLGFGQLKQEKKLYFFNDESQSHGAFIFIWIFLVFKYE